MICKNCKKEIKTKETSCRFNEGTHCNDCFAVGYATQNTNLMKERLKQTVQTLSA